MLSLTQSLQQFLDNTQFRDRKWEFRDTPLPLEN